MIVTDTVITLHETDYVKYVAKTAFEEQGLEVYDVVVAMSSFSRYSAASGRVATYRVDVILTDESATFAALDLPNVKKAFADALSKHLEFISNDRWYSLGIDNIKLI